MTLHPPCGPENRGSRVFARLRRILALPHRGNPRLHLGSRLREEGPIRRGYTFSLTSPLGLTTTFAYSYGKLTTTTDPLGRETHYSYDSVGRMIRVTDALGGEVSYTYDSDGNRTGISNQRGQETLLSVDALSRVTSVTYPDDAIAKRSYNAVGKVVRTTDPLGNTTLFEYDAGRRQTARVDPEGERTEYEYDAAGNRTALIRAEGTALEVRDEYGHDSLGRLVSTTRAVGSDDEVSVSYAYDANGNVTSITNGRGYTWTFTYDAMNRLLSETDPLTRTREYFYDLAGQLVERQDPKGQKIQYDYDGGGRVTEARYIRADESTGNTARMAYDAVGNMVEVTDSNVDISQTFDDLNRITVIDHDHLDKIQRQGWDAAGNRTWMSVDEIESSTATYTWDSRNQLTQIDHDTMGTVTYTYNAAGQKITMVLPNDIDCDYTYDDNGRLTNLDYRKPDESQVFFEDLTYDARSNITRRVDDEGTHDYQYDDLDQLARADYPDSTYEQFAYDEAGNRTSVTTSGGTADYTVDAADQLTQIDGPGATEVTTFGWTDNGEMVSQLHSSATTPTTYGWDTREMLVQVSIPDTGLVTHAYAPSQWLGWRVASTDPQGVTSKMLWDPVSKNTIADLASDNTTFAAYLEGPRYDQHLAQDYASSSSQVPILDHLGSVAKLSTATRAVVAGYQYFVYGEPRNTWNPENVPSQFTYTGRPPLPNTAVSDNRARWYSPPLGSFLSNDPIGLAGRTPLYAYANGSPAMLTDPLGLLATCPGINDVPSLYQQHYGERLPPYFGSYVILETYWTPPAGGWIDLGRRGTCCKTERGKQWFTCQVCCIRVAFRLVEEGVEGLELTMSLCNDTPKCTDPGPAQWLTDCDEENNLSYPECQQKTGFCAPVECPCQKEKPPF